MNIIVPALDAGRIAGRRAEQVTRPWRRRGTNGFPENLYRERPSVVGGLVHRKTGQGLAAMRAGSDIVSTFKGDERDREAQSVPVFPRRSRNGTETVAVRTGGAFALAGTPQERRTPPPTTPGMGQRIDSFLGAHPGASRTDVRKALGLQRGKSAAYQAFMTTWPNGTDYHPAG